MTTVKTISILAGVSVVLLVLSWVVHATCSPALSSCDISLVVGKVFQYAAFTIWPIALLVFFLGRRWF